MKKGNESRRINESQIHMNKTVIIMIFFCIIYFIIEFCLYTFTSFVELINLKITFIVIREYLSVNISLSIYKLVKYLYILRESVSEDIKRPNIIEYM